MMKVGCCERHIALLDSKSLMSARLPEWARANAEVPEDITAYGKSLGQIGHRMFDRREGSRRDRRVAGRRHLQQVLRGAARMGEFLSRAGIVGEPEISILDSVDVPGTF